MRVRAVLLAVTATALLVGPLATPAGASTGQGCSGTVSSVAGLGVPLDTVAVPGASGTTADPFRIYWSEPVTWTGQTPEPVTSGTWRLTVQHPSWLFALGELTSGHSDGLSGTFDTGQGATSFTNTFTPSSIEPVTLPGNYEVAFTVTGPGGVQCTGTIAVRVMDSPLRNPLFWLAFILIAAGLVMLFVFGMTKLTRPTYVRTRE